MNRKQLRLFLDEHVDRCNRTDFIGPDPISIPHSYSKRQDIEISGLIAAIFSWGNRTTILRKAREFLEPMGESPHDFILHHEEKQLRFYTSFVHRTFQPTDALWTLKFLQGYYRSHESLEEAFLPGQDLRQGLIHFHSLLFADEYAPTRSRKHFPTPERNSSCKRLNMYLRWMVRRDDRGVDFGLWTKHSPTQLYCPIDLHVHRMATQLGLVQRKQIDWKTTVELTNQLRALDPVDPIKYDLALFSLGLEQRYHSIRY